jgi:leucyl-tRNA synthetase
LQLLAPFAPHITEELWQQLGHEDSIHLMMWPKYDEKYLVEKTITIVVQVNGKLRAALDLSSAVTEAAVVEAAHQDANVQQYLAGKDIKKTIYVPGKLVNFVV